LYLPLYNEVEWLEIGVPVDAVFAAFAFKKGEAVSQYTVPPIAHGACASRPEWHDSILEKNWIGRLLILDFFR